MTINTMAKFKNPMDIHNIPVGIIYSIFYLLFVTPFIKYPCKKCVVQAACSKICIEKEDYDLYLGYNGKLWEAKLLSSILWLVCILVTTALLI